MKLVALALAALVLAAPAAATSRPSVAELETELVCPECHETLDESSAPIANEMKALLRKRVAQGWTKKQIIDEMVANFGPNVLSTPSTHGFDLLAWVLPIGGAAVGIAGVLAFSVSERANEIGIRMSLGADRGRVQRMILGEGGVLLGVGLGVGVAVAFFVARVIRGLLFGVAPHDPTTFVTVAAMMTAIGVIACWIPANRASRIDPAIAMRA